MKRLVKYFKGKSVKQRIIICIVLTAFLTLIFFSIKAHFFDVPTDEAAQENDPQFHISLTDAGLLIAAVVIYSIHKIREKRKQGRL